jgi:hypothetical protein
MTNKETIEFYLQNHQCPCNEANFAVIGTHSEQGSGVLAWFVYEIHAKAFSKAINQDGGISLVDETPKGDIPEDVRKEINSCLSESMGIDMSDNGKIQLPEELAEDVPILSKEDIDKTFRIFESIIKNRKFTID